MKRPICAFIHLLLISWLIFGCDRNIPSRAILCKFPPTGKFDTLTIDIIEYNLHGQTINCMTINYGYPVDCGCYFWESSIIKFLQTKDTPTSAAQVIAVGPKFDNLHFISKVKYAGGGSLFEGEQTWNLFNIDKIDDSAFYTYKKDVDHSIVPLTHGSVLHYFKIDSRIEFQQMVLVANGLDTLIFNRCD